MKIKFFSVIALVAIAFTSCSKDESGVVITPDDATQAEGLYLKFSQGVQGSKADAAEVVDGTAVTFSDGWLLFLEPDATGESIVSMAIEITSTTTGGQSLTVSQLQSGTVITNVSEKADKVVVLGNVPSTLSSISTGAKYADIIDEAVDLADQADSNWGVSAASLFGDGLITDVVSGSNTGGDLANADREAIFDVYPLIARLEVLKMTSKDYTDAGVVYSITDYTLAGIYINNFYYEVDLSGALKNQNYFYDFGTIADDYLPETKGGKYLDGSTTDDWTSLLFDEIGKSQTSNSVEPTNFAWAYNVFATPVATPQIVFHLTGVTYSTDDGAYTDEPYANTATGTNGEAYLTVNKYFNSNNELSLQGGNIYRISDLGFTYDDLKQTPGGGDGGDYQVYVEIHLLPWTVINVDDVEFK
ncbi:MAG: hypothetical protein LUG98_00595 [Tannerellaceae bacterium]|nr:hypothetical protein [Tannerellaceae bacterium]